ncbi:MAG: transposase [Eubacteriales bacterium]
MSKYDSTIKRARKITGKLIGKITQEDGFVESSKNVLRQKAEKPFVQGKLTTKEFGTQQLVLQLAQKQLSALELEFGDEAKPLFVYALFRLAEQSPIKNIPFYFMHSFLSETWKDIDVSEKRISQLLRKVGLNREKIVNYQKHFISAGQKVLIDMTHVVSRSHNIEEALSGYNNTMSFDPQVNLMYLFSVHQHEPVYYRLLPGNIRDVKAFALTIQESQIKDAVLIADKGFYSKKNTDLLNKVELSYIIPLQRGNSLIPYITQTDQWDGYFIFNEKVIWYRKAEKVTLFWDQELKIVEEKDYIKRIEAKKQKYSLDTFYKKQSHFGTLALFSSLKGMSAEEIYTAYKSRANVETMFDAMKNIIDSDRTYMQNSEALEGWMFVNHLALQFYYLIYQKLLEHKLLKKYSVMDFLKFTHRIKKIKINNQWYLAEITKPVATLLDKLKLDIT